MNDAGGETPAAADGVHGSPSTGRPDDGSESTDAAGESANAQAAACGAPDVACFDPEEEPKPRVPDPFNQVVFGKIALWKVNLSTPWVPLPRQFILSSGRDRLRRRIMALLVFQAVLTGQMAGKLPLARAADYIFGYQRRPRQWRRNLRRACDALRHRCNAETLRGPASAEIDSTQFTWAISAVGLAELGVFAQCSDRERVGGDDGKGRLKIIRRLTLGDKVTDAQLQSLWASGHWSREEFSAKKLRNIIGVRREKVRAQNTPTLSTEARAGRLRPCFLPAVLGDADVVQRLGKIVVQLGTMHTRGLKIIEAMIPDLGGYSRIKCPLLDEAVTYDSFAGNSCFRGSGEGETEPRRAAKRHGRGFRLPYWAKAFGTDEERMLTAWRAAAPELGMVVVGIGPENNILDLDEIIAAGPYVRERLNVRVYVPGGWTQRWAELFRWPDAMPAATKGLPGASKESASPPTKAGNRATDLPVLQALVGERGGVRKLAAAIGVNPGNLSRALRGQATLAAATMAALREQLDMLQVLGGPGVEGEFAEMLPENATLLDWALAYRRVMGWSIIPLRPVERRCYLEHWKPFQTALPTEEQISQWWTTWPDASIALVLGPVSGVLAIDIDSAAALETLKKKLGRLPTNCPMDISGSGDLAKGHYYFKHPARLHAGAKFEPWGKGLELRGAGGLLIVPPSHHWKTGNENAWADGQAIWQVPLGDAPRPVLQALRARAAKAATSSEQRAERQLTAGDGSGFSEDFSTWEGKRLPSWCAEWLRTTHRHGHGWNEQIHRVARKLRDYAVPQEIAEHCILQAADPVDAANRDAALATVRSAYAWLQSTEAHDVA